MFRKFYITQFDTRHSFVVIERIQTFHFIFSESATRKVKTKLEMAQTLKDYFFNIEQILCTKMHINYDYLQLRYQQPVNKLKIEVEET